MIKRRLAAVLLTILVIVTIPTIATVASASTEPTVSDSPGCLVFVPFHCDPHPKAVSPVSGSQRLVTTLLGTRYHEGDGSDGNDGGNYGDNDNRRCHNSENCRGSFSPGPFDRSPVDIHDNCISPDCSRSDGNKDKQQPKK